MILPNRNFLNVGFREKSQWRAEAEKKNLQQGSSKFEKTKLLIMNYLHTQMDLSHLRDVYMISNFNTRYLIDFCELLLDD